MLDFSKKVLVSLSVVTAVALTSCAASENGVQKKEMTKNSSFLDAYSDIALANYTDAVNDAIALKTAIDAFAKNPTQENIDKAKKAWLNSRESYGQTEAFRLSNGPIDSEDGWIAEAYGAPEGQINAWPLDENMIDYTIDADGKLTSGNIIDTVGKFNPGGEESKEVDVSKITVDAITELNENGGEANVATGYHAIEFLLWGQDQDYSNFLKDSVTPGAMTAGLRTLKDFTTEKNADRRLAYLQASAEKLVSDLETIKSAWEKNIDGTKGLYQAALKGKLKGDNASKNIESAQALKQIIAGMGVFVKSELANERIAVAVLTPSEEDEHSCFSDNTHRDILNNYIGFKNILTATYKGKKYGPSLLDAVDAKTKTRITNLMKSIEEKINSIDEVAKTKEHFDYQIRPESSQSKVIVKLKNELRKLGDEMVNVAAANKISLSTDDVTDPEETKL
ncbi:imelysin-like iron-regulated protein A-like protein, IrpA family [Arcobacter venerupis]|uniref:Imelysin-like iron-regulated protein A-like protein, IrpA family n=1 Tax=Arcobacter venerupis TaxID=1054033 RepID=A0AAE7B9I0_9BACT|nr:imelysin family protein [Arcobacter venerupis]QKF67908.1 imelysin-like iron-regulated protein A-like protein, IrpA family [Arcobacter venerupis]RWS49511.1 imelysin [Arcobacter venerupis]